MKKKKEASNGCLLLSLADLPVILIDQIVNILWLSWLHGASSLRYTGQYMPEEEKRCAGFASDVPDQL